MVADGDDRLVERACSSAGTTSSSGRVQAAQDVVAADDRRRVLRDDEAALVVGLGVAVRVERRGRLRQAGEERRLGRDELREVGHAEVDVGRGGDPVGVVAVEDLVQVGRDDLLLAGLPRETVGDPRGLDELLRLADVAIGAGRGRVRRQEPRPDELLGDRRGAAVAAAARVLGVLEGSPRVEPGFCQNDRSSAVVVASRTTWEPRRRRRPAVLLLERPGRRCRVRPDDGRLVEGQRVERRRVRQVAREGRDGRGRGSPTLPPTMTIATTGTRVARRGAGAGRADGPPANVRRRSVAAAAERLTSHRNDAHTGTSRGPTGYTPRDRRPDVAGGRPVRLSALRQANTVAPKRPCAASARALDKRLNSRYDPANPINAASAPGRRGPASARASSVDFGSFVSGL